MSSVARAVAGQRAVPGNAPFIHGTRILAYHGVHAHQPDGITISPSAFCGQMDWLKSHGWRGVTLGEFCAAARRAGQWPQQLVALTFDDGYVDCLIEAAPVLASLGFSATVFVITDTLESEGHGLVKHCHRDKQFLDVDQLSELIRLGWEIGSHTCDHSRLPTLAGEAQAVQLQRSKEVLESRLGRRVDSFCYPGGKFDEATLGWVAEAGYAQACVTPWRRGLVRAGDWRTLERVGVYRGDGPVGFRCKMSPWFQRVRRVLQSLRRA